MSQVTRPFHTIQYPERIRVSVTSWVNVVLALNSVFNLNQIIFLIRTSSFIFTSFIFHKFYFQVFWLKDGDTVDVSRDINLIISNEGNLIINQARMSDMGNYTCGAQNVASRRTSESATLTVFGKYLYLVLNHFVGEF